MKQFMVALHGKPSEWNKFSEDQQKDILGQYMAWAEKLASQDRFKGGSELYPSHRELKSAGGKIVIDGPFPETKEVLTGYFVIKAESLEEAAEMCKECPALSHGDRVQVYEMPDRE